MSGWGAVIACLLMFVLGWAAGWLTHYEQAKRRRP